MSPNVIIAGGGVIGAATAYYLTQRGVKPTVLEACTTACSASGKAGGFLALDWCDGGPLENLARTSFALHAQLADTLGSDRVGYRRVKTHSVQLSSPKCGRKSRSKPHLFQTLPSWVDPLNVTSSSVIGTEDTTAQVNPEWFTKALMSKVVDAGGAVWEQTEILGINANNADGSVSSVRVKDINSGEERSLDADVVVLALGAWSSLLPGLVPPQGNVPDISGLKVHSIVLQDDVKTSADALFLAYRPSSVAGGTAKLVEPEVYPRPDDTVYICGVSSEEVPPSHASEIQPRQEAIQTLKEVASAVNGALVDAPVLREQACFLPCTTDGMPVIGPLHAVPGVYIATGHSCWGILNAPATGLAMSELIMDGASHTVDITAFNPSRFSASVSRKLHHR